MTDSPRFSVTIPAYNAALTLAETVGSVRGQTFDDWEIVIVDDGSTDHTRSLAEGLASKDPRIRVISQENRGSGGAYNTAVRAARADLVVMLSADDLLLPDHLDAFDAFVRVNPDAAVFTCDGLIEYEDGRRVPQDLNLGWADPAECTLVDLLSACFFGNGAVYRREVFEVVGGFREDLYAEDYLFWLLALAHGFRHRYLDRPLAVHRRNSTQKSADVVRVREADILTIRELIDTGRLSLDQRLVAERVMARHQRNVNIRKVLGALVGQRAAAQLIDRYRPRQRR